MERVILKPAYGRDYKEVNEVKKDWNGDKDFVVLETGQYINRADWVQYCPDEPVTILFNDGNQQLVIKRSD